jgi:5-methylcytosine-specific restriction endonuclease McrA
MIKINVSSKIIENFKNQVLSNFYDQTNKEISFKKVEDKKLKWNIDINAINRLIKRKLKHYPKELDLEKLITLDYKELCDLKDFIDKHKSFTELNKTQKDYFYTLYQRLNKPQYIDDLDITVCPYCNRNYIFNFKKSNSLTATAQLDHFFDKSTYPFFSVSIFNLVPSCQTCNQRKSTKANEIYHPFIESLNDDVKFGLKIKDSKFYYDKDSLEIEKKIIKNEDKVKSHIKTFNIQNLYNEHKDIALELIQKAQIYNESYIDELYQKYEGTLFKNREDVLRHITGGYIDDKDINKRPLSKLIKDISEELDLI